MAAEDEHYLLRIGIDWAEARRDTEGFIREVDNALEQLRARAASGAVTPIGFGKELAEIRQTLNQVQQAAGRPLPPGLGGRAGDGRFQTIESRFDTEASRAFSGAKAKEAQGGYLRRIDQLNSKRLANLTGLVAAEAGELSTEEIAVQYAADRLKKLVQQVANETELAKNAKVQAQLAAEATVLRQQRIALERRLIEQALAEDGVYISDRAAGTIAKQQREATEGRIVAQGLAGDPEFIRNEALTRAAEARRRAAVDKQTDAELGIGHQLDVEKQALNQRLLLAEEAVKRARLGAGVDADIIALKAKVVQVEEERLRLEHNALISLRSNGQLVPAGLRPFASGPSSPYIPGGPNAATQPTFLQRAQAVLQPTGAGRTPRSPESFQTGPQLLGSGLLSTARFAASAALLYGAFTGIRDVITNAQELDKILNQVEAQFNAIGEGAGFKEFRSQIFQIARETGVASKDIAFLSFQLKGAFGDSREALENAAAAAKIVKVTGLSLNEVTDSMTATAKNMNVSFESLGDRALGIQERFGVQAKETLAFFGDLSPVAKDAGLSVDELAAIAGVAQQRSGAAGSSLAEAFGRIIPQVQGVTAEIISLYTQAGKVPDSLLSAARENKTGKVLLEAVRNADILGESGQRSLVELLGGRREAQSLVTLLEGRKDLNIELDRGNKKLSDAGKLQSYFNELQDTLSQRVSRLAELFRQLGQAVFEGGLGNALNGLAGAATILLEVLTKVAQIVASINGATHGLLGNFLLVVGAARVLGPVLAGFGLLGASRAAGAVAAAPAALGTIASRGILGSVTGLGAGLAAAGPAAALTAGLVYLQVRASQQAERAKEAADLQALSDAQFAQRRPGSPSIRERLGDAIFSRTPQTQIYAAEQARREASAPKFAGGFAGGLTRKEYDSVVARGTEDSGKGDIYKKFFETALKSKGKFDLEKFYDYKKDQGKLLSDLEKGSVEANAYAKALADFINSPAITDAERAKFTASQAASAADTGKFTESMAAAKTQFEAGLTTVGDYLATLEKTLASFKLFGGDKKDSAQYDQYSAFLKERNQIVSKNLADSSAAEYSFTELTTGPDPKAERDAVLTLLQNPDFTDPKERAAAAQQVVQLTQDLLKAEADLIDDAGTQAKFLKDGMPIPDVARTELLRQDIAELNPLWSQFLATSVGGVLDVATFVDDVVALSIKDGVGALDAAKSIIATSIEAATAQAETAVGRESEGRSSAGRVAAAFQRLTGLKAIAAELDSGKLSNPKVGSTAADEAAAKAAAKEALKDKKALALAYLDQKSAVAGNDGIVVALNAVDAAKVAAQYAITETEKVEAQTQLVLAQRGVDQAFLAVGSAHRHLAAVLTGDPIDEARAALADAIDAQGLAVGEAEKANALAARIGAERNLAARVAEAASAQRRKKTVIDNNDPVQAARDALADAIEVERTAQGEAAKADAMAARIEAERGVAGAILDSFDSMINLAIAVANAQGDAVQAANLGLDALRERRRQAADLGLNDNQRRELDAQIVGAEATARDARLADQRASIDYQLQMEQITAGQAANLARSLLLIPDLTEQQIRDINLYIKGLTDAAGSDLRFNLPTELRLPTLYESRRLDQSGGMGSYQDNRNVNITLNANNAIDGNAAVATIVDVLTSSPRTGNRPRLY